MEAFVSYYVMGVSVPSLHRESADSLIVHTWYNSIQRCPLAGIELHHQLTVQSVRGFVNGGHHFPAAESGLPVVDEPEPSLLATNTSALLRT